ncbi:MAG TPA: GNAT family N-acetyltransferase [Ornithinicoccus sp.]|nr:GNAT family N-acetyltransferase [Ornithinicoccus sp.]
MEEIRSARPGEAAAVSALALRSKAHWGYDEAMLEAFRRELTWTEEDIRAGGFVVADGSDGRLHGFYRLSGRPPAGELGALFVDPPWIGTGLGGRLLRHAVAAAREAGFTVLELDADPGAVPFYEHAGFEQVGTSPSGSVPGRVLPRMRLALRG